MASPLLKITRSCGRVASVLARNQMTYKVVAGLFALVLGYIGWMIEKPPEPKNGGNLAYLNNLFRTFQLLTLNFPGEVDGAINPALQIARFLVPITAALTTFHLIIGGIARPVRMALMPWTQGHVVICGNERLTPAAFEALAARDVDVVSIATKVEPARREVLEGLGITVLEADPAAPLTFEQINISRAAKLLLTFEDDARNLDIAMVALACVKNRPAGMAPLTIAAVIGREDLARGVDVALDGLARDKGARYVRLSPEREALRLELARFAPVFARARQGAGDSPSLIHIYGLAGQWPQTLMQLVVAAQDHPSLRPRLTLFLSQAESELFAAWQAQRPDIELIADFDMNVGPRTMLVSIDAASEAPHLIVIMLDDGEAIEMVFRLRGPHGPEALRGAPIILRRGEVDHLFARGAGLIRHHVELGRIGTFGPHIRAETVARLMDEATETLARTLHNQYLASVDPALLGSSEALRSWAETTENYRRANRAAADHAAIALAAIGYRLERIKGGESAFAPDTATMDRLARIEHQRWMADRIDNGWRFGPVRDDRTRVHPSIRPFDELSAPVQQNDTKAVLSLLKALDATGWRIVPAQDQSSTLPPASQDAPSA